MNILALETSGVAADVALLQAGDDGRKVLARRQLPRQPRTAQTLAPAINELLREASWQPTDVNLVAVTGGPGSFTGLRLGVTTAKVFAYATGAAVRGVNTLEVIAFNMQQSSLAGLPNVSAVKVILDAQRNQVFAADVLLTFPADSARSEPSFETRTIDDEAWLATLQPGDVVLGPGLGKFSESLPEGVIIAPRELWEPQAAAIGELAWRDVQGGASEDDVWSLAPRYYRQSAAEEKRAATKE